MLNARHDILAWDPLAAALMTDFAAMPARERNVIRWLFTSPVAGRYPGDAGIAELVAEVSARSPLFARLWESGEVGIRRSSRKRMKHPVVGPLELHCDVLYLPERDQRVVLCTTTPGTPSHEALKLLRVVGTQDLASR
ncbi:hypothetical protein F8568_007525 [Actinomadura sp. LD22]|uniref:MmyB-like transcription regulator ligand binding domain-containing protein n=1 Tax=Actinomadura physcomitrii TaxID=2650748 RepID=A0A6I4MDH1_9ACTN|nr:hypothetical protein [Actinomadura physcomitrii]